MRKTDCGVCEKTDLPLNETIKIDGKTYCADCFQKNFSDQSQLEFRTVEKEADPTVCAFCEKDFGDVELNKISTYPACADCTADIKNRTFPTWVKAFFIGIVVIVVGAFFWNWKYYQAYNDIQKSNESFGMGDYATAAALMTSAGKKVPEVEDVETLAAYFRGISFLSADKGAEALAEFNKCAEKLPPEYNMKSMIAQASIGASFDKQDYQGFLSAAKDLLQIDSTVASTWSSVASAYACIYADKGDEKAKANALKYIERAKTIDSTSAEAKQYYNMIEYRLDSRKIIRREEFLQQFPNGWTKN